MREWRYEQLAKEVDEKKTAVEKMLLSGKPSERLVRRRPRDLEEQRILDALCVRKWKEAEACGKIRYINKNEWYYEY